MSSLEGNSGKRLEILEESEGSLAEGMTLAKCDTKGQAPQDIGMKPFTFPTGARQP
jgi:hypothetical protein